MRRSRILVADDNPASLRFLVDALASGGFEAVAAPDGTSAIEAAASTAFDLLLLDARMPDLDGPEVLESIRRGGGPSARATGVATTAASNADAATSLRARGFADVLVKPLSVADLCGSMHAHLRQATPLDDAHDGDAHDDDALDDAQARQVAGGDDRIVAALRSMFAAELVELPGEIARMAQRLDRDALRDRLHRLEASAGFCGAGSITIRIARLRAALDLPDWPRACIDDLLAATRRLQDRLSGR